MLPLLMLLSDKKEHSIRILSDLLADQFQLTQDERKQLLPSGAQEIFYNRVGWARTFIKKAGLVEAPKKGFIKITERGLKVLENQPSQLTDEYLLQYPEFKEFLKSPTKKHEKVILTQNIQQITPLESLEQAYQLIQQTLESDLLQQVRSSSPGLFEKVVIELLVKMGYGGNLKDAGEAIGGVGDEGIDGIIKEDPLGLDIIYIQAKRWANVVGRPEVQKFAGALQGQRARKGIFITTSSFTKEAQEYAKNIETKLVLIDGGQLTTLMIDNNIGVNLNSNYELKKIDLDYFTEE
jgi:restriction system protein